MKTVITIETIDEAISGLNYSKPQGLKCRFIEAIRRFCTERSSVDTLREIDANDLIKDLWDVGDDPALIKKKRKNLSSVKSAVNKDLKDAYKDGRNPQGIIVGRNNVFVMCDEAKDKVLSSLSGGGVEPGQSLIHIAESLDKIEKVMANAPDLQSLRDTAGEQTLAALRQTIEGLTEKLESELATTLSLTPPSQSVEGEKETLEDSEAPEAGIGNQNDGMETHFDDPVEEALDLSEELEDDDEVNALDVLEDSDEEEEDDVLEVDDLEVPQALDFSAVHGNESGAPGQIPELQGGDSAGESDGEVRTRGVETPQRAEWENNAGPGQDEEGPADAEMEGPASEIDPDDEALEKAVLPEAEADLEVELTDDNYVWETPDDSLPFGGEDETDNPIPDPETQTDDVENATDLDSDIPLEGVEAFESIGNTGENFDALSEETGEGADEVGLPESPFEADEPDESIDPDQKARLLAEAFDGYLGAMERYYNQYLLIPEGNYAHGGSRHEALQTPASTTELAAFYMGKFPVTNALFEVFVERTGYVTLAEERGHSTVYHGRLFREKDKTTGRIKYRSTATVRSLTVPGACWYRPTGPGSTLHQKRNHPVVHVALKDALAFAAWTGKRLPTEAEWEAAARTQRGLVFPWGNEWKGGTCNIEDEAIGDTTPVNAFKEGENELGIADTLGNVLEWTSDISPGTTESLPAERHHILKGGSWTSQPGVRLTNRFKMDPQFTSNIVGFRCAVD